MTPSNPPHDALRAAVARGVAKHGAIVERPNMATCIFCNVEQPLSSMAATVNDGGIRYLPERGEDGKQKSEPNPTIGHCCYCCAMEHDKPGKFQANGDLEGIGTALVLHHWSMDDGADDYMTNEGWGYCGRFGRYLLFEDDRGFVTYEECPTVAIAEVRYENLYREGWGACEDDWYIRCGYEGYECDESLGNGHWQTHTFPRLTRARAFFRIKAAKEGYYPNLWLDSERGNLQLLTY